MNINYLSKKIIPTDHCFQTSAFDLLMKVIKDKDCVCDLGCGTGKSINSFKKLIKQSKWIELDIPYSPEIKARKWGDFVVFDGIKIPFKDESFDIIFCRQVLEHVENFTELLKQANRVLKKGGCFVGSVSYLEPLHSFSLYNFTPLGLQLLFNNADFEIIEFRPGIDSFTLIIRNIFFRFPIIRKFLDNFYQKESPINTIIRILGKIIGKTNKQINHFKLLYCGHICFLLRKKNNFS